jgi:hypothetical protein
MNDDRIRPGYPHPVRDRFGDHAVVPVVASAQVLAIAYSRSGRPSVSVLVARSSPKRS